MATPLTVARDAAAQMPGLWPLFLGTVNGSLGETSGVACLLGGLYLCLRRTASWEVPLGMIGAVAVLAGLTQLLVTESAIAAVPALRVTVLEHLTAGALLFGAFYIAEYAERGIRREWPTMMSGRRGNRLLMRTTSCQSTVSSAQWAIS